MNIVIIAIIASLSPVVLAVITGWQRGREKREDWARQDARDAAAVERQNEVASQAAEAARLLQEAQAETSRKTEAVAKAAEAARVALLENQELVAKTAAETHEKLEVIRVDVNSNMTEAMKSELAAKLGELEARLENIALKSAAGDVPSAAVTGAIKELEGHIAELQAKVKDRLTGAQVATGVISDASAADV